MGHRVNPETLNFVPPAEISTGLVGAGGHLCAGVPLFIFAQLSEAAEDRCRRHRGAVSRDSRVVLSSMAVVLRGN